MSHDPADSNVIGSRLQLSPDSSANTSGIPPEQCFLKRDHVLQPPANTNSFLARRTIILLLANLFVN